MNAYRPWRLPKAAGRRLFSGATATVSPAAMPQMEETLEEYAARCPHAMGYVGSCSWVPGGHLRVPLGLVCLRSEQLKPLSLLTEADAQAAGFPDLRAFRTLWAERHADLGENPWVWVLRWDVVTRAKRTDRELQPPLRVKR